MASLVEDAPSLSDADLAEVMEIALDSSEIVGRIVSPDGRVGGVAINFILPTGSDRAVTEVATELETLIDRARTDTPDIDYYLTGQVVLGHALAATTEDDLKLLAPVMFLVISTISTILLRSVLSTLSIIVVFMFSVNSTMGFAGWNGTVFNSNNAGVPLIVMVMAVASSMHVVVAVLSGMRQGLGRNEAIVASIRNNATPVFLTSATTAIGFLSLNFSDSPPFRVMGNYVAFGMMCAFLYSVTVMPALLSILPLRVRKVSADRPAIFERLGAFVVSRRKFLLWFVCLVSVALITGVPRVELSDNWTRYFDERYEFRRDTDFINENLTGLDSLEFSLESGSDGGITDPGYLRTVDAFAEWFRSQPEILHVQAFPDIVKRLNKVMNGDDPTQFRLPDDPELAAQYLLLYELSLPFGIDLNDRIDVARSATRMSAVIRNISSREQIELDERAQAWLRANAPALATPASGFTMIFAHLSTRNIKAMLLGTSIGMALVSLILIWVFRSVWLGLLTIVPNFLPAILCFGLWGYLVGRVGMAASVTTAISFGIVVDDSIHFLTKYLRSRNEGHSPQEAVLVTFRTVGFALWTTTVVLAAGFLVFAMSGFEVSWSLGMLVSITIVLALFADFLLLPTLLMAIDRRKS